MAAQVALALVLLVASGLMVRSFQNLRAHRSRVRPASTLTFRIGLPEREYPDARAPSPHITRFSIGSRRCPA